MNLCMLVILWIKRLNDQTFPSISPSLFLFCAFSGISGKNFLKENKTNEIPNNDNDNKKMMTMSVK